jgi:hypothetical protein
MPSANEPNTLNAVLYAPPADNIWLVAVSPDGVVIANMAATQEDWNRTKERAPQVYLMARALLVLARPEDVVGHAASGNSQHGRKADSGHT